MQRVLLRLHSPRDDNSEMAELSFMHGWLGKSVYLPVPLSSIKLRSAGAADTKNEVSSVENPELTSTEISYRLLRTGERAEGGTYEQLVPGRPTRKKGKDRHYQNNRY